MDKHKILQVISDAYDVKDYPALAYQIELWSSEKPFQGLKILDATPVFRNTLVKYLALLAGGADLSVGISTVMPYDTKIIELLKHVGINIVTPETCGSDFDIILDCAASFLPVSAKLGYVELTRSGIEHYRNKSGLIFVADSGRIKKIETLLGTGESLFRALKSLNYHDFKSKKIVVFGSGKVGSGVILYGNMLGAMMNVVTDMSSLSESILQKCVVAVDFRDHKSVADIVVDADIIVTATGHKDAIDDIDVARAISSSHALLANMGVDDEYGKLIAADRVLNGKRPLNFILDEPTHLKFIEATMALHNAGAKFIVDNPDVTGLVSPSSDLENQLLEITSRDGKIADELKIIHGLM